jgi:hypothetical protein
MSRRRRGVSDAVVALLTAASAGLAGCQAEAGDADCELTQEVVLAGAPSSPLLLLPSARLDQVGDAFFLIGSDGTAVRWAALAADGTLSPEQAFSLPAGVTDPIYAVAGLAAPGDTVLIGYLGGGPSGTGGELDVVTVLADGSQPPTPASSVLTFPAGVPAASTVAMMSSRLGMNAGLAWVDATAGEVMFTTIDGRGHLVGDPTPTFVSPAGNPTASFECLGFSAGKSDLTVVDEATDQSGRSTWTIADASEQGTVDNFTALTVSSPTGCAVVTPTDDGYALAWQDDRGSWLAVYVDGQSQIVPASFAPASSFGGAALQPPLVGLAPFGSDFGVVLEKASDVELWRLDATGNRRAGALIFPSISGNLGTVSALPVGGRLVATYADFTSMPGAATVSGRRLLVDATCY